MNLTCENCRETLSSYLSDLPEEWAKIISNSLCESINFEECIDCNTVKDCETLTSLSEFSRNGLEICITYTDEKSVETKRCFDFGYMVEDSLVNIVPGCLSDGPEWSGYTDAGKWQAIIDKACGCCEPTTTTTSTTTTSSTTTTTTAGPTTTTTSTTTTTTVPCTQYTITNNDIETHTATFSDCETLVTPDYLLFPEDSITVCAVTGSVFAEGCDITVGEPCSGGTTSTTTTTTEAPTTTTTTSTTTEEPTTTSTTTTTTQPYAPLQARYSAFLSNLCSRPIHLIHINAGDTFGTGTTVYTDPTLLSPLTGTRFIVEISEGIIYNIDFDTGVIGSPTGNLCGVV